MNFIKKIERSIFDPEKFHIGDLLLIRSIESATIEKDGSKSNIIYDLNETVEIIDVWDSLGNNDDEPDMIQVLCSKDEALDISIDEVLDGTYEITLWEDLND